MRTVSVPVFYNLGGSKAQSSNAALDYNIRMKKLHFHLFFGQLITEKLN